MTPVETAHGFSTKPGLRGRNGPLQPEDSPYFSQGNDHVGMTQIDSTKQYQQPLHFDIPSFSTRKSAICFHFERICSMEMAFGQTIIWCFEMLLVFGLELLLWFDHQATCTLSTHPSRQEVAILDVFACWIVSQRLKLKHLVLHVGDLGDSRPIRLKNSLRVWGY